MVYSKLLKPSNLLLTLRFNNVKYISKDTRCYLLKNQVSIFFNTRYASCPQYSTFLYLKHPDQRKLSSISYVPVSVSAASISTIFNNDKYEIIITNPKESSNTLDASLGSSFAETNRTEVNEVLSSPASDFDIATNVATTQDSIVDQVASAVDIVEPSFASIGLANYTPAGAVQMFLEYLHITMHWPWWLTIISCTVIARILLFPLLLKTQRNALQMSIYMPQLQYLQAKFGEARRSGNSIEASRLAFDIMQFMKEHKISPMKNAMLPMLQAPIFLSFFFALRGMAKAPVESMKYGGLSWTTDLTIPDPYYVLPVVSCATFYIILKVGAESGMRMDNMKLAKYLLTAMPIIVLPFCIHFPSAILYYWCTNNFCTLAVVSILKIKPVREYFNLPQPQPADPKFALPKKGFVKGVKEAYEDQKVIANLEDRKRMDDMRFQKAGIGPVPRTYSYDPTKPRPTNAAAIANRNIAAKKRDV